MESHDQLFNATLLWLELSGLPAHLNEKAKQPYVWSVFQKIILEDLRQSPARPGVVETTIEQLARGCGLDGKKIRRAIVSLRKAGVIRAFLPDDDQETSCMQVVTPIPTPRSADVVRAESAGALQGAPWPPRYSVEVAAASEEDKQTRTSKIQHVADLYMNTFSMRLNSLIVDELQLIADRYDLDLIEKVFVLARKKEARSLGWVVSEIRRETTIRQRAAEIRNSQTTSSL